MIRAIQKKGVIPFVMPIRKTHTPFHPTPTLGGRGFTYGDSHAHNDSPEKDRQIQQRQVKWELDSGEFTRHPTLCTHCEETASADKVFWDCPHMPNIYDKEYSPHSPDTRNQALSKNWFFLRAHQKIEKPPWISSSVTWSKWGRSPPSKSLREYLFVLIKHSFKKILSLCVSVIWSLLPSILKIPA